MAFLLATPLDTSVHDSKYLGREHNVLSTSSCLHYFLIFEAKDDPGVDVGQKQDDVLP